MTSRLCLWELDKLPKTKAKYMASKKKIFSLTGHAISSISTSYQVKFRVRKFVPSANPPHNQYHLLSVRFISGIECMLLHIAVKRVFIARNENAPKPNRERGFEERQLI